MPSLYQLVNFTKGFAVPYMLKNTLFTLLVVIGVTPAIAQEIDITKVAAEDVEWSEGLIYLASGEKLSGLVKLNTRTGLLAFESGATSRSFTPRNVSAFEFFDVVQNKKRSFISVDYEAFKSTGNNSVASKNQKFTPSTTPQFFEILIEFPSFALLSSIGQMQVKTNTNTPGYYDQTSDSWKQTGLVNHSTTYSQTDRLFIFDADGNISLLVDITDKETDRLIFDSKKTISKNYDNNLLEQYTKPHFEKLKTYAKESKLSFKKKEDLVQVLEYYKKLISN